MKDLIIRASDAPFYKGAGAKIRKEIAIATKECLRHEGLFCALVSHGSFTVPQYIVKEINELGGTITNTHGISKEQLKEVSKLGIAVSGTGVGATLSDRPNPPNWRNADANAFSCAAVRLFMVL